MDTFLHKLGFVFTGILMLAGVVLLMLLLIAGKNLAANGSLTSTDTRDRSSNLSSGILDGPNAVADGFDAAANAVAQTVNTTGKTIGDAASTTATTALNGVKFVGNTVSTGFALILNVPGSAFATVASTPSVSAFIQPGKDTQIPVIAPYPAALVAAHAPQPSVKAANTSHPEPVSAPIWPIRGRVTTLFGVPHWPYQPTHTGLDISSGRASGVTPIKPFKAGQVIDTIWSASGLGNHVIVDHGGGVTSVYAHLSSISVKIGQKVTNDTTLGYEGSTGASTGTHLHFEIRLNGQPTDPRPYIN